MMILAVGRTFEIPLAFEIEAEREGYEIRFRRYEEVIARPEMAEHADLILVGSGLSAGECIELCLRLRGAGLAAPIIVAGEAHSEKEAAAVLDAGADCHLAEPVRGAELVACFHALLRRCRARPREGSTRPFISCSSQCNIMEPSGCQGTAHADSHCGR